MRDLTIISYPGSHDDNLLSLTGLRSKYMVPFAGNHRVIDFTLRNAFACEAEHLIVFSKVFDDLSLYIDEHPIRTQGSTTVSTVIDNDLSIDALYNHVRDNDAKHYLLYCGDNPGFINFSKLFENYQARKASSVLFKLKLDDKATLAYTILITTKAYLLEVIKQARLERRTSPNLFEMLINMLINRGVAYSSFKPIYWPLKTVPDYYDFNMLLFKDQRLFKMIYEDELMLSGIHREPSTQIGVHAKITRSYISNGCILDGTIDNSIVFPGVIVAEKAVIRDSILLPYVAIGKKAQIIKAIIDEYTDYNRSDTLFNIGEGVRIGNKEESLKNNDYPKALFNSISLIGKNTVIPPNVKIGAASYVASATSQTYFETSKTLHDGLSVDPYKGLS